MAENLGLKELQQAIEKQTDINKSLAVAEFEKAQELKHQTDEIERDRISRDRRTDSIEKMTDQVTLLVAVINDLINKRQLENIEQLFEIIIPILSQVSTVLSLRDVEIKRLTSLLERRSDITITSGSNTKINELENKGTTNFSGT